MSRRSWARTRNARRVRIGGAAQTSSRRCGKLRYSTLAAAQAAADLKAGRGSYPDQLRAYECPLCLGAHVTSQPKRSGA